MPGVTVIMPSLSVADGPSLADRQREYPRLAWCLGAATIAPCHGPLEAMVLAHCGLPADTSIAALTAAHDLADGAQEPDLLRSDPVYLHADPNKVLVYAPAHLQLTADDADALLGALQREFPELGFRRGDAPTRWYVRRPADVAGQAPSTDWLHGRSITPFMPLAATERAWRRWLNDLQMVLHEQPVNRSRVARGLPAINGVWWFGAGEAVVSPAAPLPWLLGNDVLLAGLARRANGHWQAQAEPAAAIAAARAGREVLLIAGHAFGRAADGEGISVTALDAEWVPALLQAVRRRQLTQLTITTATHRATLGWWQSLQRWRRPRAFIID